MTYTIKDFLEMKDNRCKELYFLSLKEAEMKPIINGKISIPNFIQIIKHLFPTATLEMVFDYFNKMSFSNLYLYTIEGTEVVDSFEELYEHVINDSDIYDSKFSDYYIEIHDVARHPAFHVIGKSEKLLTYAEILLSKDKKDEFLEEYKHLIIEQNKKEETEFTNLLIIKSLCKANGFVIKTNKGTSNDITREASISAGLSLSVNFISDSFKSIQTLTLPKTNDNVLDFDTLSNEGNILKDFDIYLKLKSNKKSLKHDKAIKRLIAVLFYMLDNHFTSDEEINDRVYSQLYSIIYNMIYESQKIELKHYISKEFIQQLHLESKDLLSARH